MNNLLSELLSCILDALTIIDLRYAFLLVSTLFIVSHYSIYYNRCYDNCYFSEKVELQSFS